MRNTVVYIGPTISTAEAKTVLSADYRPPARRGDLARLPASVRFVGIVDGEFYQSLAISTKEIVALLRRGVHVFGASSMGALRAAETHTLGTVGIGRIFGMFRDGILDADDEVAMTYEPGTYRNISEPMVNLRNGLDLAVAGGALSEAKRNCLIEELKACYFPQRSWSLLERLCPELTAFFQGRPRPDLKRDDARLLLRTIKQNRELARRSGRIQPLHTETPIQSARISHGRT